MSQNQRTDALGLSAIHVNRVLRQLGEDGLVTFHGGSVTFDAYDRLIEFAEFDPTYLEQVGPLFS